MFIINDTTNKLRLIKIIEILRSETDDEHSLTTNQLIERLADFGIQTDRRVIYKDIVFLTENGFAIEQQKVSRSLGYYMAEKQFSVAELKILIDALHAANFVTARKTDEASNQMVADKSPVIFDGKYTPDPDGEEYLFIDKFELPQEIISAIKNPQALEALEAESDEIPKIKALFVGVHFEANGVDTYSAAFQKFKSDQYISATKIHLFLSGNTFVADNRIGLTIGRHIDCLVVDGKLQFPSFFFARQVFDLSEYYREATNSDIVDFVRNEAISMDNGDEFSQTANSWERRKIASIMDSGILQNYTPAKIKSIAKQTGIDLSVEDNKIVIPTDKRERRIVLGFLDEEVYKGAFTQTIYQTNSKRKAK